MQRCRGRKRWQRGRDEDQKENSFSGCTPAGKTLDKKVKDKHKKWKFRRQKNLHEVLRLTSGVEDGSDDGEGEGNKEEEERGDDVGCHQQRLLRRLIVDVSRLNHKHDSGDFKIILILREDPSGQIMKGGG